MITIRNEDKALSLSVRAATDDLTTGMLVVMVQSAAAGDQPLVRKATGAEMINPAIRKFIVEYDAPDSNEVDFDIDVVTQDLVAIAKPIPVGAQVNVWTGDLVIAYHESAIPASLRATREATAFGFDATTNLPSVTADAESTTFPDAGGTPTVIPIGIKYRIDGPEHTFLVRL
jgi:hypothetical protein